MTALLLAGFALFTSNPIHAESTQTVDSYRIHEASSKILSEIPKNLARWYMGATLVIVKDDQFQRIPVSDVSNFDESIFLSDNSALSYKAEKGQHDYIIDLGKLVRVSRFFLNNQNAAGTFQLLFSDTLEDLDSHSWFKLSDPVAFEKGVIPSITFPEIETRYILVRFNIESAGAIGNFGLTGTRF